jgi:fermentation-respiration switch protein FrsA (DUF1100 family)
MSRVTVPLFVLGNSADHLVPASHQRRAYEAAAHNESRELHWVKGATHYYTGQGQIERMAEAVTTSITWLQKHGLL